MDFEFNLELYREWFNQEQLQKIDEYVSQGISFTVFIDNQLEDFTPLQEFIEGTYKLMYRAIRIEKYK